MAAPPVDVIVDTHVHFWDLRYPHDGLEWSWIATDEPHPLLGRIDAIKSLRYDLDSVWAEARFSDVAGFVHVQAALDLADPVAETRWLDELAHRSPVPLRVVGDVDLGSAHAARQLDDHLRHQRFVGVRDPRLLAYLAAEALPAGCAPTMRLLAEHGLTLDVLCQTPHLPALARLASNQPGLSFVLEHLALPIPDRDDFFAFWRRSIQALGEYPNIHVKVSCLGMTDPRFTVSSARPWFDVCLETFGPDRMVVASNWPQDRLFSSYAALMDCYRALCADLSGDERRAVLSGTAGRLYDAAGRRRA